MVNLIKIKCLMDIVGDALESNNILYQVMSDKLSLIFDCPI